MTDFKGRSIEFKEMFGLLRLNCYILGGIYIYMLTNISKKRKKRKINFDELQKKKNSRIKITKIKNMRFGTKVLKCIF